MVRRMSFFGGLILGSGLCAWLLGTALTYFFTGKLSAVRLGTDSGPTLVLVDADALFEMPLPDQAASIAAGREAI